MKDLRKKVSVLARATFWNDDLQVIQHGYVGEYRHAHVDPTIIFHHGDAVRFVNDEMLPDPVGRIYNQIYAVPEFIFNCFVFSE